GRGPGPGTQEGTTMRMLIRGVLGVAFFFTATGSSLAMCDPTGADVGDIAAAQADIAANCNCVGATTHGEYVSCASDHARTTLVNQSCRGKVVSCAARSTCGKPGFVVCCRKKSDGTLKCSTKLDCTHCVAPDGGDACCSTETSCCGASGVSKTGACDAANSPPCATT